MSSASKTLELLRYFSPELPEIGLTQLCRLTGWDKATTYRRLQSLEEAGFVEQNLMTRNYRLGPALLQLAHTREITVPRRTSCEGPLHDLANATGETTHVSVLSGKVLYKLMAVESPRHSIRVVIDIETFPLHATASGLCVLAFGSEDLFDVAKTDLSPFTANTVTSVDALRNAVEITNKAGYGRADCILEDDVYSLAAPVFDQSGFCAGAVSTAAVVTRFTPALERIILENMISACRLITHKWGGTVPANVEHAWSIALTQPQNKKATR